MRKIALLEDYLSVLENKDILKNEDYDTLLGKNIQEIPDGLKIKGDNSMIVYTLSGTPLSYGYRKIIVNAFGAFIQMVPEKVMWENIIEVENINSGENQYCVTSVDDKTKAKIFLQKRKIYSKDNDFCIPGYSYIDVKNVKVVS